MNRTQLLLAKLAEEAGEVAKLALKSQQFGLAEVMPGQPLNNAERAHEEIDDFMAAIEMLNDECGFGYVQNRARIEKKKAKVNKFAAYSASLGMVMGNAELGILRGLSAEYNDLIFYMDAGGDYFEFMAKRIPKT